MEVARSNEGTMVSQRKYILVLLKETCMSGCHPAKTPIDPNYKIQNKEGNSLDQSQYKRLVGKWIYFSLARPDIAFAYLKSQFMHSLKNSAKKWFTRF